MAKCLSFHAPYQCRLSGACCGTGWTIPFAPLESARVEALSLARGALRPHRDQAAALMDAGGACSFFDGGTHLCEIHKVGGHAALPLTCRMFPRSVLHDSRGTFISLSHFCPTAAALLFEPGSPVSIVDAPSALAGTEVLDGLDARDAWPPLLRPGVLMDLESYATWERLAIELLTRGGVPAIRALDALCRVTARITAWTPGSTPLLALVEDTFAGAPRPPTAVTLDGESPVKRWLAARLFACWVAYQGNGLSTIVAYLRACLDAFTIERASGRTPMEAIRQADRLIVHDASSQAIARLLEGGPLSHDSP